MLLRLQLIRHHMLAFLNRLVHSVSQTLVIFVDFFEFTGRPLLKQAILFPCVMHGVPDSAEVFQFQGLSLLQLRRTLRLQHLLLHKGGSLPWHAPPPLLFH